VRKGDNLHRLVVILLYLNRKINFCLFLCCSSFPSDGFFKSERFPHSAASPSPALALVLRACVSSLAPELGPPVLFPPASVPVLDSRSVYHSSALPTRCIWSLIFPAGLVIFLASVLGFLDFTSVSGLCAAEILVPRRWRSSCSHGVCPERAPDFLRARLRTRAVPPRSVSSAQERLRQGLTSTAFIFRPPDSGVALSAAPPRFGRPKSLSHKDFPGLL
jgi:hypothetical protein